VRLGVLDIGSDTVHLLAVNAWPRTLREGVILRRRDTLDGTAQIDRSAQDAPDGLGRLTMFEARCTG
jgi:hypothetical protein